METATGGKADSQEPSMEDILASIRRILSEDTGGSAADAETPKPAAAKPRPVEPEPPDDQDLAEFDEPDPEPLAPMDQSSVDDLFATPEPEPEPAPPPPPPRRPAMPPEDIFLLSPQMRAGHTLVSAQTAGESTDVLSQLARAILDRRDIAVVTRDVTLEGMVREMLRPLLREWLDRNLPYLIERLVKKEIDLMINRAERLED